MSRLKYIIWSESYEHFHKVTKTSQTDARQSIVTVLHTSDPLKWNMDNPKLIVYVLEETLSI